MDQPGIRKQLRLITIEDRNGQQRISGYLKTIIASGGPAVFSFFLDDPFPVAGEWDIAILDISETTGLIQIMNLLRQENPDIRILRFATSEEAKARSEESVDPADIVFPESPENDEQTILNLFERSVRVAELIRSWKIEKHLLYEYRSAVDAGSILSITDPKGIIKYANKNFCEISGYSLEELLGKPHNIIRHPDMPREAFKEMWQTILDRKVWKGIVKNRKKDGDYYVVNTTVSPVLNESGDIVEFVSLRSDITDLVKEKERTTLAATTDPVTGLLNRFSMQQALTHAPDEKFQITVINLNGFSVINEFYGEKAGDSILQQIGHLIKKNIDSKYQVYRASGDEFVILGKGGENLLELTVTILEEIRNTAFPFDNMTMIHVAATAGVAQDTTDPYREALAALKHARLKKEPCVVYSRKLDMREQQRKNADLSSRVIRGIIHDKIVPFYQPIVDLQTGTVQKYEALLRLICDDGIIVSPIDTIRIARLSGQYRDLTQTFLRHVFQQMESSRVELSVNLTYDDLTHEGTVDMIFNSLKKGGFADRVTFEITEAVDMEDFELVKGFISTCKSYGARSAIDDFGSGYSNFVNLLELDIDYLKIDGSLVEALPLGGKTENIIRFIVEFARGNRIQTIGEFVSSGYLAEELKKMGVDFGQGFHLGKPAPASSMYPV